MSPIFACIAAINNIRQEQAEVLLRLTAGGVPLSPSHKSLIREAGLDHALREMSEPEEGAPKDLGPSEVHLWLYEVPVAKRGANIGKPFEGKAYFDKIPKAWKEDWTGRAITKDDWRQENPEQPDAELRAFINSHIPHFQNLKAYKKFWLYCEQARRWEASAVDISDVPVAERYDWKKEEMAKIRQNKLYGINRYISIKEDGKASGRRKYRASTPQALLCFLVDLGVSFDLVKGRQAAITSTMMAIAALEAMVRNSYNGVFITHKKDGTGKKLFKDKFQSTLQNLPSWMRVAFNEDSWSAERVFIDFAKETGKGNKGRDSSEFLLLGSEDTQVMNGQTPTQTFFDECQNIATYQTIKSELDPTMFQFNEETGFYDMVRAVYAWGTGSSNNTGKGAFEADFKGLLEAWETGEETYGWVPVFMDWTCRPGMTKAFYMKMRTKYLRGQTEETKGLTPTERLSLFKAHYPSEPDDAFMTSHKTLVPMEYIVECQTFIKTRAHNQGLAPIPGRFKPILDESKPVPPGGIFTHAVRGVIWEELAADDLEAPIRMMYPPTQGWVDRYFQGTDPIQNDGGHSRFSSAIWDTYGGEEVIDNHTIFLPTVACMLNYRSPFPQELFVQCILMGMYYANHGQRACKEIVEINQGHRYVEVKTGPTFNLRESLMYRGSLLPAYNGGEHLFGVDLKGGKGSRKEALYHDITNLLRTHGRRIFYYDFWSQVRHISVEDKGDKGVVWGTENKNVYNDDMVYAVGYAEMCARSANARPRRIDQAQKEFREAKILARRPNGMPYYETRKIPVKYA